MPLPPIQPLEEKRIEKLRSLAKKEKLAVIKTAKAEILEAWNAYHIHIKNLKKKGAEKAEMKVKIQVLHNALK